MHNIHISYADFYSRNTLKQKIYPTKSNGSDQHEQLKTYFYWNSAKILQNFIPLLILLFADIKLFGGSKEIASTSLSTYAATYSNEKCVAIYMFYTTAFSPFLCIMLPRLNIWHDVPCDWRQWIESKGKGLNSLEARTEEKTQEQNTQCRPTLTITYVANQYKPTTEPTVATILQWLRNSLSRKEGNDARRPEAGSFERISIATALSLGYRGRPLRCDTTARCATRGWK